MGVRMSPQVGDRRVVDSQNLRAVEVVLALAS